MYYKTWQPDFEGFYETRLSFDFENLQEILFDNPKEIEKKHFDWVVENVFDYIDYKRYENDVAKLYFETWFELANFDFVKAVKFDNLYSPKEYNFATDSINIQVNLNFKKLVSAFKNHPDSETYIKQNYKSYDGFLPYYSNIPADWLKNVRQDSEHKIGAMLGFLGDVDLDEIYEGIIDEIYQPKYINYTELLSAFNDKFETEIQSLDELANFNAIPMNPDQLQLELVS